MSTKAEAEATKIKDDLNTAHDGSGDGMTTTSLASTTLSNSSSISPDSLLYPATAKVSDTAQQEPTQEITTLSSNEGKVNSNENSPTNLIPSSNIGSLTTALPTSIQPGDISPSTSSNSCDTVASENAMLMEEEAQPLQEEFFLPSPVSPPRTTAKKSLQAHELIFDASNDFHATTGSTLPTTPTSTTTDSSTNEVSLSARMKFVHARKPSTIAEENSQTLEEDERNPLRHDRLAAAAMRTISSMDDLLQQPQQTKDARTSTATNITHSAPPSPSLAQRSRWTAVNPNTTSPPSTSSSATTTKPPTTRESQHFTPLFASTRLYRSLSRYCLKRQHYQPPFVVATWLGFWAMLHVTCANYVLTPMRDAIALAVGVEHMPKLTLASTVLAFVSSVPIGWLFEAPDPGRRLLWKRMGLTRGETQGTSLALFYRFFALVVLSYAAAFQLLEWLNKEQQDDSENSTLISRILPVWLASWWGVFGQGLYVAFFLVAHLMKLHSLSLMWGVTTEAMEYEDVSRKYHERREQQIITPPPATRLERLGLVGFGGTVGGILGSGMASSFAQMLRLPGLLILAAILLEISAELSIELGRVMQKHWEEQLLFQSTNDLASLDGSMKRSASMGSMKRVASGNSLNRVKSATELSSSGATKDSKPQPNTEELADNTFMQRLMRGAKTIVRSRLLMAIFTYNALYASTNVLLSFQRAALVANRSESTSVQDDTSFLAKINICSSVAIFALQASGAGAYLASVCGSRGTLSLMPLIRLAGVLSLVWWHQVSHGQPPNLVIFLVVDECCKIMNLAVAKPVRESLWRGLSNEARYEAKPIVDTLANRWGGGSAAFLVSFIHKTLDLLGFGTEDNGVRTVFGIPPITFLCVLIAAWWAVVSADLGHVRHSIDLELKKRQ